jgi:hypothetical protein
MDVFLKGTFEHKMSRLHNQNLYHYQTPGPVVQTPKLSSEILSGHFLLKWDDQKYWYIQLIIISWLKLSGLYQDCAVCKVVYLNIMMTLLLVAYVAAN